VKTSRIHALNASGIALGVLLVAAPAAAQGNGRGNAFGHTKAAAAGAASAPSATASSAGQIDNAGSTIEGTGIRNFGSWLDDASIVEPGTGFMSVAVGYWRTPSFTEVDAPSFDVGIGLRRRVQIGASVPVYHASQPGTAPVRGMGDLYLSSKIQLRDPAAGHRAIGLAVIPIVEVSSTAPADGASRMSWALPIAVEVQRRGWRAYGSSGYFSRGAVFASGAIELAVSNRAWVTGSLSQSHSTSRDDLSDAMGLSSDRTDVSGGAGVAVANAITAFGSIGRTISRQDASSSKVFVTGGLSLNFAAFARP
jgi:hypothetical protein